LVISRHDYMIHESAAKIVVLHRKIIKPYVFFLNGLFLGEEQQFKGVPRIASLAIIITMAKYEMPLYMHASPYGFIYGVLVRGRAGRLAVS